MRRCAMMLKGDSSFLRPRRTRRWTLRRTFKSFSWLKTKQKPRCTRSTSFKSNQKSKSTSKSRRKSRSWRLSTRLSVRILKRMRGTASMQSKMLTEKNSISSLKRAWIRRVTCRRRPASSGRPRWSALHFRRRLLRNQASLAPSTFPSMS